mmetsp:Transcript_9186/g.14594  ORF Transcript_9186/g.14594 Transcript_9186/m.14594 type:complete len:86 (-) Transcript_9186:6-263(-)
MAKEAVMAVQFAGVSWDATCGPPEELLGALWVPRSAAVRGVPPTARKAVDPKPCEEVMEDIVPMMRGGRDRQARGWIHLSQEQKL